MKKFNLAIFICLIIYFTFFGKTFAIENKIVLKINNAPVTSIDIFNEVNRLNFFEKKINQTYNTTYINKETKAFLKKIR